MNAARVSRLRFIDFVLQFYGHFNRSALEDFFGISTMQASLDIGEYTKLHPDNLVYNKSLKRYEATPTFQRRFP